MLELLQEFASRFNRSEPGRQFAGAFETAIQLRWTDEPHDPADMPWFGGDEGSWACLVIEGGHVDVVDGDRRADYDWRFCPLVETDAETLRGIVEGTVRPLDAYLTDRLHVSHFTAGGTSGQWVLALLAFGARTEAEPQLLPTRPAKRFMTYPYHAHVEARRAELLAKIGHAASS